MHTDASMFVFGNTLYCYALKEKVETQNLASHKQECAINWGDYVPVITAVFARETQGMHLSPAYHCMRFIAMDCSWDARFCVSTWLTPSLLSIVNVFCDSQSNQSRDAKFCVSQARIRNKQMRNMSVNAALFARETQGWAINKCDYIPAIAAFFARETQDFASLQGWRRHIL